MKKSGYYLIILTIYLFGSSFSPIQDEDPRKMTPPEGKSLLYIVRPSSQGEQIKFGVSCDGKEIGTTKGKKYIYAILEPGKHKLVSRAETEAELEIITEAGKTYFVRQKPMLGLKEGCKLSLIDEATGRKELKDCKLAN